MHEFLDSLQINPVNAGVYTDGRWLETAGRPMLRSLNPASNGPIAAVSGASEQDYEVVVTASAMAFERWRQVPAPERGALIRRLGVMLREHQDTMGSLVALETGKIKAEGDGEVQEMIDMADFAVGQSRMLYGKTLPSERPRHRMYEQWHPLGITGVISAFNFPLAVWAWNAFLAAICGNTVIWKPSPKAPLCALAIQHLCHQAMTEAGHQGVFSLLTTADSGLVERFVSDRRIPLISFTGSSAIGRRVNVLVAERLGRSLLELSGNNAVIVSKSADLELAIPAIVFGAVGTAGQRCTSTRRLLVQKGLLPRVSEGLQRAYAQVRIGAPLQPDTLMGPLIDPAAVARYTEAIAAIRSQGGTILCGGQALDRPGNFVQPTLAQAENHWPIVQQETFAPILYLIPYRDFDEALAIHNAVPQGLSSALFSQDLREVEHFLAVTGSDCGIANINIGTSGAEIGGAFGGEKDTGGGREAGSDAWKNYMRRQTNTINWGTHLPLAQGIRFEL